MTTLDRIKQKIWKGIYPLFPTVQSTLLRLHIIWHNKERQRFHIGWLKSGATLVELKKYLSERWGFGNHFVAWHDDGQVLSWRRLASFSEQWHLRVYSDGEIRGHYEKTPEAHPFEHFNEVGEADRTNDFKMFLGDFCVAQKSPMRLFPDPTMTDPVSEVTVAGELSMK